MLIATRTSTGYFQPATDPIPQPKMVTVYVEGGVIQDIDKPEGVVVKVMDYDVEGDFPCRDDNGRPCCICFWH